MGRYVIRSRLERGTHAHPSRPAYRVMIGPLLPAISLLRRPCCQQIIARCVNDGDYFCQLLPRDCDISIQERRHVVVPCPIDSLSRQQRWQAILVFFFVDKTKNTADYISRQTAMPRIIRVSAALLRQQVILLRPWLRVAARKAWSGVTPIDFLLLLRPRVHLMRVLLQ